MQAGHSEDKRSREKGRIRSQHKQMYEIPRGKAITGGHRTDKKYQRKEKLRH